ncbi:MAG: hypothetical protein ACI8XB_001198 [Patiriisocius sp.]|jgi:hypothetical protein
MKSILYSCLTLVCFSLFVSCGSEKTTDKKVADTSEKKEVKLAGNETQSQETREMITELQRLVKEGNAKDHYHWNAKRAQMIKGSLDRVPKQQKMSIWFKYLNETLNAGDNGQVIAELENFFNAQEKPYSEQLGKNNQILFELLALAHLRKGEIENCQNKHTPFSCIVPIQDQAIHELKSGSTKAIELYEMLLAKMPKEKYLWLLNVAYMTLGEYPDKVPEAYRLTYPNAKLEIANFPRFEEISMNVGVGENGLSGGTSIDDFNNDGHLDIFATSYGMKDQVKMFFSDGNGGYVDMTDKAGLTGIVSGLNCIHADYNNDGNRDILILRGAWLGKGGAHPNSLLKNNGDGTFEDVTKSSGLLSHHPTQTASWGDFNKDGQLDLFIGNESKKGNPNSCELYKNNGDGTFTEVADQHGLGGIKKFVKGTSFGDINNDGWPDLFISVMGGKNFLYKNENGNFTDIGSTANVRAPINSFPCWFWDVNQDGYQDIFVSGYEMNNLNNLSDDFVKELLGKEVTSAKPRLYINNGDETFSQVTKEFGVSKTMYSMGANYGDLDNDGYFDFYVGTGSPDYSSIVPNRLFLNKGGKGFDEVTSAGGFGHIQKGHGIAFADLDRDGDQDVYAVMGGAFEGDQFTNALFENPITKNNWITVELEGVTTNRDGIGSLIILELDNGKKMYHSVSTGGSFGASSIQQEIGLGKAKNIKKLIVKWQNGVEQVFENVSINQKVKLKEAQTEIEKVNYETTPFAKNGHMGHNM